MSENLFLTGLKAITAGELPLVELIRIGNILQASGDPAGAEQLYSIWIKFNPDHPQRFAAYFNLAALPVPPQRAAEVLAEAIRLAPEFWPAYVNRGTVLERAGDTAGAIQQWTQLIDKLPQITGAAVQHKLTAYKQVARVLLDGQQGPPAEQFLARALELDPRQRDAMEQYVALRLGHCEWPVVLPWEGTDRETLLSGFSPLSMGCYTDDPLLQLANAVRYVQQTIKDPGPSEADRRHAPIEAGRPIRVGYVSSDYRDHAIGYLMPEVMELHDRSKVEVFVYYCGPKPSGATYERYRAAVENWREITDLDDETAARQVAADGIDILVDVNGHTRFARPGMFARKPAPVLVNWLGFPGTMGTPFHHYIIGDEWIIPPGSEIYYTEKVVRLPCYQSNDRKRTVAERPSRTMSGLPEDAFVFCCFNGSQKISRFTFDRWMQIMNRTPNSVLWLLSGDDGAAERLRQYAEANGVARDRLIFAPKVANPWHLARYPLADLFLDTSPYGAHTTASDALFMGVPVLTLNGRSFATRVCGSLVSAAGLPDLVCETPEQYVERAIALAADPEALRALRERLEANRATSTLFDMNKLVSHLEGLYAGMCEDYRAGRLPQPDLDNIDAYHQVGLQHDPELVETQTVADYHGMYLERLARRHRFRPMKPDGRLWTEDQIAKADGAPAPAQAANPRKGKAAKPLDPLSHAAE